jgi:hypothetical protein
VALEIVPPSSVLLLVGREEFTPPTTFGGRACVATVDCVAIAVASVNVSPTSVTLAPTMDRTDLVRLADVEIESEGLLSLRDVYSREYDAMGVVPGLTRVVVWGDSESEPSELAIHAVSGS